MTVHYFHSLPKKKGGRMSFAAVFNSDTRILTVGSSKCCKTDTFDKHEGRLKSLERAINAPEATITVPQEESPLHAFLLHSVAICKKGKYPVRESKVKEIIPITRKKSKLATQKVAEESTTETLV